MGRPPKNFERDVEESANINLHDGHRSRQRKKIDHDVEMEGFEDHEALEFRLGLVIPRKDTNELAHLLINKFGSLDGIHSATPKELYEVKGMTLGAAYMLATDVPFIRKSVRSSQRHRHVRVSTPTECIKTMFSYFIGRRTECLGIGFVDVNYRMIRVHYVVGTSGSEIEINVNDIVKRAIREGASSVILAHNHPTGNLTPSFQDLEATENLYCMLKSANMNLLDHVIFHDNNVFSFNNNGIITKYSIELNKRSPKSISATPETRLIFMGNLKEHMLDPMELAKSRMKAIPQEDVISTFFNGGTAPTTKEREAEDERQRALLDGIQLNSVIVQDAYKAISDYSSVNPDYEKSKNAETQKSDELVTYEIDFNEVF